MIKSPIPIKQYVEARAMKWGFPVILVFSLVVALTSLIVSIGVQLRSDRSVLRSVSRHLESLISIEDRPEVNRLLESIAMERQSNLWVVRNENVYGASGTIAELDRPAQEISRSLKLFETSEFNISTLELITHLPLNLSGAATLYLSTPLVGILWASLWITVGMTLLSGVMGYLSILLAARAASRALNPVGDLATAISQFGRDEYLKVLPPTAITELETIRTAIDRTHKELATTQEALASSKARAVVAEVYGSVLHDLGGLSLSLNRIAMDLRRQSGPASEAQELVDTACRVSDDIVRTIEGGKSLLEISDPALGLNSLQESISAFIQNRLDDERIQATKVNLPVDPVLVAHDPVLIHRALENLLSNAHQHAKSEVALSLVASDRSVSIEVADDGPGMKQELLARFLKGKGRSSHESRPAFGLMSTHHIVRTHGARLIYRASKLGGALFEIRFPREAASP